MRNTAPYLSLVRLVHLPSSQLGSTLPHLRFALSVLSAAILYTSAASVAMAANNITSSNSNKIANTAGSQPAQTHLLRTNTQPLLSIQTPNSQWQPSKPPPVQNKPAVVKPPAQVVAPAQNKPKSTNPKHAAPKDASPKTVKTPTTSPREVGSQVDSTKSAVQLSGAKPNEGKLAADKLPLSKKEVLNFVTDANQLLEQKDITAYAKLISDDALLTSVVSMMGESYSSVLTKAQYIEETRAGLDNTSNYDYRVQIDSITILPKLSTTTKRTSTRQQLGDAAGYHTDKPAGNKSTHNKTASTSKPTANSPQVQAVVKSTVTEKVTLSGMRFASTAKETAIVERVDGELKFTKIDGEVFLTPLTAL